MSIDETPGKRYKIESNAGQFYFFISENNIMSIVPNENHPKNTPMRVLFESLCRISSLALKNKVTLSEVAEQLKKADRKRGTVVGVLSERICNYCEGE